MWLVKTLGNRTSALADERPATQQTMAAAKQPDRKIFEICIVAVFNIQGLTSVRQGLKPPSLAGLPKPGFSFCVMFRSFFYFLKAVLGGINRN
jgi:hypothetical protein